MTVQYYGPKTATKALFNEQLIDNPPPVIAIDTETISLTERLPILFAIATRPDEAWVFDILPERDLEIELLQSLMSNPSIRKAYANVMFDIKVQELIFLNYPFDTSNIADVLVWARLLGRTNARLADLAAEVGRSAQDAKDMLVEYGAKTMLEIPHEAVAKKCANDAMVALALHNFLEPQVTAIEGLSPDYLDVERKVVPVLIDMSQRGLAIDQHARELMEKQMEIDRAYFKGICEELDFNPGSGMQRGYILAKRGSFLPLTRTHKQYRTNEETLELLDDPLATIILEYGHVTSILTKYLYPMRKMERLYTNYGLDTEVGRTKSSDFNMQNIPSATSRVAIDVRHILYPDTGTFTTGDYSQEHLRILMYMSGDKEMERVYYDGKADGDIHKSTMRKIHKPRSIAKIVNYATPYGGDPHTLAKALKTKDLRWCSSIIDDWFDAYPDAAEFIKAAREYGFNHLKSLPTLFGRQIAIPEEWNRWGKLNKDGMERKGVNYPILGSDGEVMKRALIVCAEHNLPLAVQVHDSITCDGDIIFPVAELESIAPVNLPFEVEKSERWK